MEKYIWKITNYFFICIVVFIIFLTLFFVFKTTINNIIYYDKLVCGILTKVEYRSASSSDGPLYSQKVFTIESEGFIYKSTALDVNEKIKIGDKICGIKKAENLVRILSVNSEKIYDKYNLVDFISFIIPLLLIGFCTFFLIKKIK